MECPLCFQPLGKDTIYLNSAGDATNARYISVEPPRRLDRSRTMLPVQEERLIAHETCECLHPLVTFAGREDDARQLLNEAQRVDATRLGDCVTGVLPPTEWGALKAASNEHWSFVRMRYLALNYPDMKSMCFPERLFPFPNEPVSVLPILVTGPRKTGKSVLAALAANAHTYSGLSREIVFQENFCYAAPRVATRPSEDYENLLKAVCTGRASAEHIGGTDKQSSLLVAAFFANSLPASTIDSVAVYDIAGESYEKNYSIRAHSLDSPSMYWCILIAAEDLLAFQPGQGNLGSSVTAAVDRIRSARPDQRIVITITKLDAARFTRPSLSPSIEAALAQIAAIVASRAPLEPAAEDPQRRRAAHLQAGVKSRELLRDLLEKNSQREGSLKTLLLEDSKVRAVFFTGAEDWGTERDVRPFGIGRAICWMAEDLSEGHMGATGMITGVLNRVSKLWTRKQPAPEPAQGA